MQFLSWVINQLLQVKVIRKVIGVLIGIGNGVSMLDDGSVMGNALKIQFLSLCSVVSNKRSSMNES